MKPAILAWTGLFGSLACSSAAQRSEEFCQSSEDCPAGQVCADKLGVCYPSCAVAPKTDLAFDICEPSNSGSRCGFRSELEADDAKVEETSLKALGIARQDFSDHLAFRFGVTTGDTTVPAAASLELSQPSRLKLDAPELGFDIPAATAEQLWSEPVSWAYYYAKDLLSQADPLWPDNLALIARAQPTDTSLPLAWFLPVRQGASGIVCTPGPDACDGQTCLTALMQCPEPPRPAQDLYGFELSLKTECARTLEGEVVAVDREGSSQLLDGVVVDFAHALEPERRLGVAATTAVGTVESPRSCASDADCAQFQFCDGLAKRCVLDLAGRTAGTRVSGSDPTVPGGFALPVYTYCEPGAPLAPIDFTITAKGTSGEGPTTPELAFTYSQGFLGLVGGVFPPARLPRRVCLPAWAPPQTVVLPIRADPALLVRAGEDTWTCCSTACLPREFGDPPVSETLCHGSAGTADSPIAPTLRFETGVAAADIAGFETAGCLQPDETEGSFGRFSGSGTGCDTGRCELLLSAGGAPGDGGDSQSYSLRIEPPVGSMHASMVVQREVRADTTELDPVDLNVRNLLFGRVEEDPELCEQRDESDCGAELAVVVAERLRMPDEDPKTTLGPFFYTTRTFFDPSSGREGAFILPVNPGVYLMTVLPGAGGSGGPTEIAVVDLRGSRNKDLGSLTLSRGIYVTLVMEDFHPDTTVLPLDVGSWQEAAPLCDTAAGPGCVDLDDPATCYGTAGQGCRIRALVPEGGRFLSLVSEVSFTARGDKCEDSEP